MTHAASLERLRAQAAALVAAGKPYATIRDELIRSTEPLFFLRRESVEGRTLWRDAAREKGRPRPVVLVLVACRGCGKAAVSSDAKKRFCSGPCRARHRRDAQRRGSADRRPAAAESPAVRGSVETLTGRVVVTGGRKAVATVQLSEEQTASLQAARAVGLLARVELDVVCLRILEAPVLAGEEAEAA